MKKPPISIIRRATPEQFRSAVEKAGRTWILDTETNGLMVRNGQHRAEWIGMTPHRTNHCFIWTREEFDAGIRPIAEGLHLVGHNLRFDALALDLDLAEWDDTMLHLAHGCTSQPLSLDEQARSLGWKKIKTSPMLKSAEKWGTNRIHEMDEAELCEYLWDDCVFTSYLWNYIQRSAWAHMDRRTEDAVRRMEARGVRLYDDGLHKFERLALGRYEEAIAALATHGFTGNINAPKQVGDWLHGAGVKLVRNPKSGWWKTDAQALRRLAEAGDERVLALLSARTGHKLGYGLVANLRGFRTHDGMIYPSVRTTGARTGRFSYSDPPLQQAPKRDKVLGPAARGMFGSRGGYVCGADFSQVELRVAAALSGEDTLLEAFASGRDPHTETAASALGIPFEQVTESQRFGAKAINFGILNGMKAKRLSLELRSDLETARRWIDDHRKGLPRLHEWMEGVWSKASTQRVVRTLSGRTRVFTADESTLPAVSQEVQGTAAELMRSALVALDEAGAEPILVVHDEIICQNPLMRGSDVARIMSDAAQNAFPDALGSVRFDCDGGEGERWADVH